MCGRESAPGRRRCGYHVRLQREEQRAYRAKRRAVLAVVLLAWVWNGCGEEARSDAGVDCEADGGAEACVLAGMECVLEVDPGGDSFARMSVCRARCRDALDCDEREVCRESACYEQGCSASAQCPVGYDCVGVVCTRRSM